MRTKVVCSYPCILGEIDGNALPASRADIERRSPSDDLKLLREKMQEYQENGAQLGWLIDRQTCTVEIYRPGQGVEVLNHPESLSGGTVLPGFVLDLALIW